MKFAIVILNWNGVDLLRKYLPKVQEYSNGADIYVIDNASDDDSVSFVKSNYPHVQVVVNTKNGGFTKGYNEGLKDIKADVYCLLNSDVAVTPNWLDPIKKNI